MAFPRDHSMSGDARTVGVRSNHQISEKPGGCMMTRKSAGGCPSKTRRWGKIMAERAARSSWTPVVVPVLAALLSGMKQPIIDTRGRAESMLERPLQIPLAEFPAGPMTRARQRRALVVLASAQTVAVAAAAAKARPSHQAFATGLMAPGGGFLYTRDPARFATSLGMFAFSLLLWFGAGSQIAPPLVWVGAAALAACRVGSGRRTWDAAPYALGAAVVVTAAEQYRLRQRTFAKQLAQASAANGLLASAEPPLRGDARPTVHAAPELDDDQLALTRRFVDMALQHNDDWSNWTVIDQFQPAALRYQIDAMINALAMQRYTRSPSATAYLDLAQRRLIERYQQKKVWGYWALENLWGNLEWDPNPAKKQNIMMTGYFALSIGLYQTVSGDYQHSRPDALTFRWNNRRTYGYSLGQLCSSLTADYLRSPWGLMVCEPNWIFSICNSRGGTALRVHDRLHGTNFWDQVKDGFVRGFEEEILRPDGVPNAYRSSRTGLGQVGVGSATDLRPLMPHVADRGFVLLKAACQQSDGQIRTPFYDDDRLLDPGNYSFNPLGAYAAVMEDAQEAGDTTLYEAIRAEMAARTAPYIDHRGWFTVDGASTLAYTALGRAMFGRTAGWLDLVEKGMPAHWRAGPIISDVPYPDVMIARAVGDGNALHGVLRSTNRGGRFPLGLDRLHPRRTYTVSGSSDCSITADDQGRAVVTVDVDGRREIEVIPDA